MIWIGSKTLAVVIGAFVGVWSSYLLGAPPLLSLSIGTAAGLLIFFSIRKR